MHGKYFSHMRDGVREPPPDPVRKLEEELRNERRARPGKVIRPSAELPSGAMVVVLQSGTYHRLDKVEHPVRQCVNRIKWARAHGRIAWWGPVERLGEALPRVAKGEDVRPCMRCMDTAYKFKYGRPKKPKDDYADIEWVDDVLTDEEAERIIRRAKDIDVDEK